MPLPIIAAGAIAVAKSPIGRRIGGAIVGAARSKLGKLFGRGIKKGASVAGTAAVGGIAAERAISAFQPRPAPPMLPNLPAIPGSGLPALPQGKKGGLQAYGNTGLQGQLPDMLDLSLCRNFYRAPKGYVIVRDPSTGQYVGAVRRDVARRAGLWKPSAKPPISATEWKHYKSADRVSKKLKKIAKSEFKTHRHTSTKKGRCK